MATIFGKFREVMSAPTAPTYRRGFVNRIDLYA